MTNMQDQLSAIEEKLAQIERRLSKRKLKDNLQLVSTAMVAILGLFATIWFGFIDASQKKEDARQEKQLRMAEDTLKQAEIFQTYISNLSSTDSLPNALGFVGMFLMNRDLGFKILQIDSPAAGYNLALRKLYASKITRENISAALYKYRNANPATRKADSTSFEVAAVENANGELKNHAKLDPQSKDGGEFINKYLHSIGDEADISNWSVAFAEWCYLSQNNAKLSFIKTTDIQALYNKLHNYISNTPHVGDIVFFNFQGAQIQQCGIVTNFDAKFVYTIEGDDNSGQKVAGVTRYKTDAKGFAHIPNN